MTEGTGSGAQTVGVPADVDPPATPRPHLLPLRGMAWERFQDLVTDVFNELPEVDKAYLHGGRGEKQDGVDGFAELRQGDRWSYQTKQQEKLTKGNVDAIVAATTATARRHYIVVSGMATVPARNAVAALARWRLWDGDDVCRELRRMDRDAAGRIIDHHFGTVWRRTFLGTVQLSAFVSPTKFFAQYLEPGRLFDHALTVRGREQELAQLIDFAQGELHRRDPAWPRRYRQDAAAACIR